MFWYCVFGIQQQKLKDKWVSFCVWVQNRRLYRIAFLDRCLLLTKQRSTDDVFPQFDSPVFTLGFFSSCWSQKKKRIESRSKTNETTRSDLQVGRPAITSYRFFFYQIQEEGVFFMLEQWKKCCALSSFYTRQAFFERSKTQYKHTTLNTQSVFSFFYKRKIEKRYLFQ